MWWTMNLRTGANPRPAVRIDSSAPHSARLTMAGALTLDDRFFDGAAAGTAGTAVGTMAAVWGVGLIERLGSQFLPLLDEYPSISRALLVELCARLRRVEHDPVQ